MIRRRLAETFVKSRGDLPSLYRALIDSPETWDAAQAKFKTPWEWTVSSLRGLGVRDAGARPFAPVLTQLGQSAWRPGSPAGFDDIAASWAAPEALVLRVEAARRIAEKAAATVDARGLAEKLYPGSLSESTRTAIARAESPAEGLALLLVSPEFVRR